MGFLLSLAVVVAVAVVMGRVFRAPEVPKLPPLTHTPRGVVPPADPPSSARRPGDRPDGAVRVQTPAVIEPTAESHPCRRCGGRVHVDDHAAREIDGQRLRVVSTRCSDCGHVDRSYFAVTDAERLN